MIACESNDSEPTSNGTAPTSNSSDTISTGIQPSSGDTESGPSSDENWDSDAFINQLRAHAGQDAIECGEVKLEQPSAMTNQCVTDSFNNQTAFYATYQRASIDSSFADGVSMDASGIVNLWTFDNSIIGQSDTGSSMNKQK